MLSAVQNLGLTAEQRNDITQIIEALQRYVDGQFNETVGRRNFRRRVQQPGETFDDFLMALRELAKTCKFCMDKCTEKKESAIKSYKEGTSEGEDLLQENISTLARTISMCHSREAAKTPLRHTYMPQP